MREDEVIQGIYKHAEEAFPEECCGIVTAAGQVVRLKNISDTPRNSFRVSPNDYLAYAQGALFMYHSHPDHPAVASDADHQCAESMRLPLMIVSWPKGDIRMIGDPGEGRDLVGRRFIYGAFDCYSLIRDFYREEMKLPLPEITRPRFGWWNTGEVDPFMDGAKACAMVPVDSPEYGDVLLFSHGRYPVVNHVAIFLGGNEILHHMVLRLSGCANYDQNYRDMTVKVLRHAA
jgi:proteasome lid subunit RPN8/RPN11